MAALSRCCKAPALVARHGKRCQPASSMMQQAGVLACGYSRHSWQAPRPDCLGTGREGCNAMVLGSRKRAQHVPARHTEVSSGVAGNAFTRATATCIAARIRGGGEGVGSVVVVLCVECRGCTYPHHFVQCKRSSRFSASCARPQCGDRNQKQMQLSHGGNASVTRAMACDTRWIAVVTRAMACESHDVTGWQRGP